jgi:hypothetical protein
MLQLLLLVIVITATTSAGCFLFLIRRAKPHSFFHSFFPRRFLGVIAIRRR